MNRTINNRIRLQLQPGDLRRIAEATGCNYDYVRQVISGSRNNAEIWFQAAQLVRSRTYSSSILEHNEAYSVTMPNQPTR